jgi:general secretion pathway protein G
MGKGKARRDRCRGLTLLELMIGALIVMLLAMIAVPGYEHIHRKRMVATAASDIRVIGVTLDSYRLDYDALPESLAEVGLDGLRDPWGNPYQYLNILTAKGKGEVRKDHSLVPINSDYDLYSMGEDGASLPPLTAPVSHDDIVRANNGRYVGLASEY